MVMNTFPQISKQRILEKRFIDDVTQSGTAFMRILNQFRVFNIAVLSLLNSAHTHLLHY